MYKARAGRVAAPTIPRPVGLGAVLDHLQTAGLGQRHDWVHVAGHAAQVHADNGPGSRRQDPGDGFGGGVLTVGVDVGEYRRGAGGHDA